MNVSFHDITESHETLTLEKLAELYNISHDQLDREIEDSDMIFLANYFDNVEYYLSVLGLTPAEQQDVKMKRFSEGAQLAMFHCLSIWKQHNPSTATLQTLLEILLSLKKEEIASNICRYFFQNTRSNDYSYSKTFGTLHYNIN